MISEPGRGTTFTLTLPAAATHAIDDTGSVISDHSWFESLTILLIDDDERVTEALGGLLSSLGATVSAHHTLESALQRLESSDAPPSLVITDDQIGPDTNAGSVIEAISARFRQSVPTLIITGNTDPGFIQALPNERHVLFKPVAADTLIQKLEDMLREK
jgi:DNA-binding NtrC family response regulator